MKKNTQVRTTNELNGSTIPLLHPTESKQRTLTRIHFSTDYEHSGRLECAKIDTRTRTRHASANANKYARSRVHKF